MIRLLFSLIMIGFLVGCNVNSDRGSSEPDRIHDSEDIVNEEPPVEEETDANVLNDIADYFPQDQIIKYFKGEGNEYASEVETIFQSEGEYLPTYVNNGGTQMLVVYQLTKEGIYLVYEQAEYYEETPPSMDNLKGNFQKEEVLTFPLEKGRKINEWEIIATQETVIVPYGTLDDTIVLEHTYEDGSKSRRYWAKELGIVKKEYYHKDENGIELSVTSELEKVEELLK